jgi:transposase
VRMVLDHEGEHASRWTAVVSISAKIGCTPQTLHEWVKKAEIDSGKRSGVPFDVSDRLKALERENRELRQANEILRKASAYFAMAELDRRYKPIAPASPYGCIHKRKAQKLSRASASTASTIPSISSLIHCSSNDIVCTVYILP